MTLHITPIGGRLAARVDGVSLASIGDGAGSGGVVKEIEDALWEHLVLVFPDQHLGDEALARAMRGFGELYIHPIGRHLGLTHARVEHIIDDADHPPYQDGWHTDVSFDDQPPRIGCLQAIQMPPRGGATLWASMYAAYDMLSEPMRAALAPLRGVHAPGLLETFVSKVGPDVAAAIDAQYPGTEHAVIGTHPVTGRRYLYVNPTFTTAIAGMHPAESRTILDHLCGLVQSPNIQYRHRWNPGEVIIWDERATQHFATSDHYPQRREVARCTVG